MEGVSLAFAGLLTAVLQWLVLRLWLQKAGRWLWLSTGGWLAGLALALLLLWLGSLFSNYGNWILIADISGATTMLRLSFGFIVGLAVGTATGVAQWVILRQQSATAKWWLPTSIIGWSVAFTLVALLADSSI